MAIFEAELDLGQEFTFTNISGKPQVSNQNGMPTLQDGETFTIFESKLKPFHLEIVENKLFSVTPNLPPDLNVRADAMNWSDSEHRKNIERLQSKNSKIEFDDNAPAVGSVNGEVDVDLFIEDSDDIVNKLDSNVEVDLSVNVGTIKKVTGYISGTLDAAGPIRAKMASGKITVTVSHSAGATQTISLANPTPASPTLTVTDTHAIVWS